jgi:hypothetical protein
MPERGRTPALANPDQAPAEHRQDAAIGLGTVGWPYVSLGASVEDMTEARRRIPILLRSPARVHWLSELQTVGMMVTRGIRDACRS